MIEQKWVDIDGIKIFYLEAGPANAGGGKPILLFIHGFLVRADSFKKLIAELSAKYRILAPDLPGCGESGDFPDSSPSFTKFADFIRRFCAKMKLDKPVAIGHSMGGGITIAAAAAYPDLFGKAILIDSISYDVKQPFKVKMVLAPGIGRFIFMKLYGWSMFSDYFKNDVFFDAKLIDMDMLKNYYDCFNPPKRRAFSYILMKLVLNPSELAELIPKIRLPVRILWGEHDTLVPIACGERLVREIKGSDLKIIPRAGHSCFDENPEEAMARIREFLP